MNARHSSDTAEHYTPAFIVEAARYALGGVIDLDPASCTAANNVVKARTIFTKATNGNSQPWKGSVFLNPPGGSCDIMGQQVIKASKGVPACTETGACGLKPGHTHDGCHSSQKFWWQKLVYEHALGMVPSAIFVSFSIELLQTSQVDAKGKTPHDFPICFPSRRVPYTKEDGTKGGSPPHSSMIVYLGVDPLLFRKAFKDVGRFIGPL